MSIGDVNTDGLVIKDYKFVVVDPGDLENYKEFSSVIEAKKWNEKNPKMELITKGEWLYIKANKRK